VRAMARGDLELDQRDAEHHRDDGRDDYGQHGGRQAGIAECRETESAEEQDRTRQSEVADKGIQGASGLAAQNAPPARQATRQNDAEDRQGDIQDGLHRKIGTTLVVTD
jgi:hypothetical protein